MVAVEAVSNVTAPEEFVKVPELAKLPAIVKLPELFGAVKVPEEMVTLPLASMDPLVAVNVPPSTVKVPVVTKLELPPKVNVPVVTFKLLAIVIVPLAAVAKVSGVAPVAAITRL